MIDPTNAFDVECRPCAEIPAWWSGFLFHILSARQVTLYLYFCMLGGATGCCNPTVRQISQDLGVSSATAIFAAIAALVDAGFILRQRTAGPPKNRRNVYQRPSCGHTVLTLLETKRVDGLLRPAPGTVNEMSRDARALLRQWLVETLGARFKAYDDANDDEKSELLIRSLQTALRGHG
ncbi:MAG: helix-turn-helix domain-containing protein [Candidatus Velthaea sp.]